MYHGRNATAIQSASGRHPPGRRAAGFGRGRDPGAECQCELRRILEPLLGGYAESWAALNAAIITELEADLPMRHLDDGRSVEEALTQEREHLRAMPAHLPATCRVVARVAEKFGHVHVDRVTYSVPIRHAYRPVWVKL